jgi:DNA polymerase-3 subunit alpha
VQTAYLKANYPAEYMAALLTSVGDRKDTMALYLAECRSMGIKVLPPDVNESSLAFTPVGTDIRFGMGAVRNVGANVVASIVKTRKEKGKYTSFEDFLIKVELVVCNKRTIESLIKAGAFDEMGHTRRDLIANHEQAIDGVVDGKRKEAIGQYDLFGAIDDTPATGVVGLELVYSREEWPKKDKLAFERDMLGLYVSDHPLAGTERILKANSEQTIAEILGEDVSDRKPVVLAGLITGVTRKITKQGASWAIVNLEDMTGSVEVLYFPKSYEAFGGYLVEDTVVKVSGHVSRRDGATSIFGADLALLDVSTVVSGGQQPVVLVTGLERITEDLVQDLRRLLLAHPGDLPVQMRLRKRTGGELKLALGDCKVANDVAFRSEIKELLGMSCIE